VRFFYAAPMGLCLIISVFYDYVTPLGLFNAQHFLNALAPFTFWGKGWGWGL